MPLNAGALDREIVLETTTMAQDGEGEEAPNWSGHESAAIRAQWLPGGTREAWQAQQRLGAYVDGVFRIYYRVPVPTPALSRVLFKGRYYDVRGVTEIGRGEGLELTVVARADS